MNKFVWALLDVDGNLVLHNGTPCIFLTRKEAREFKAANGVSGAVKKLGNVAQPKSKGLAKTLVSKKSVSKPQKTYVALILDKSGSMYPLKESMLAHFNEQVEEIRKNAQGQEVSVSLVGFNSLVTYDLWDQKLEELQKLTSYEVGGGTALYDAMGLCIQRLQLQSDIKDENVAVLFVVLTDGEENSSKTFSGSTVKAMVESMKATNRWTFTFVGASPKFTEQARDLGIDLGNVVNFVANRDGMQRLTTKSLGAVGSYMRSRSVGQTSTASYYSSPSEQTEKDNKGNVQK